nr:ATP-binding domain-containing protein [Sulfuritalea sp.]
AYLRLIANANDDTAFARVVNFPTRGIGARSLENLQDAATAQGSSLHAAIPRVSGAGGIKLTAFADLINRLREAAHLPLQELVEHVLDLSGLSEHYRNEKEGQERLANLDELVNAAASFVAEEGTVGTEGELSADLMSFLAHASLEAGEHQAGEGDDALQLMTVHSAKGLEFNIVFICGLERDLFPHENSLLEEHGLEEERRLMYVAVTRARQRLYLSYAKERMLHGRWRPGFPSTFIAEIPTNLVKWLTPQADEPNFAVPSAPTFGAIPRHYEPRTGGGFRIGQSVMHHKFGLGVIINAEGGGSDARVQVNFGAAGIKWLALSVAKLEAA